ncbi:MAG: restriction system protein [Blastocatellia bacterium]|jgi:restriction system protein|nr:restriction system protein [Blastocatellia bacterium]
MENTKPKVPTHLQLMNPLLTALKALGGSGTIEEIYLKVLEVLDLPDETINIPHPGAGNMTEVEYRLAWARTYLKKYGLLENSARGVWTLAPSHTHITHVDPKEVQRLVAREARVSGDATKNQAEESLDEEPDEAESWRDNLLRVITTQMDPSAFERLATRLLRELGFVHVEVTGRSGDGGIDGKGIARVHDVLSFHVVFQCKRYQGSVAAGSMRDFRGAMVGRGDKGLFITTGTFTRDAIREASRDGAPPIDLVDGNQLAEKLKNLGLGVRIEIVEKVIIDEDWFTSI